MNICSDVYIKYEDNETHQTEMQALRLRMVPEVDTGTEIMREMQKPVLE
jgi:hypothetical protein